VEYVAKKKCRNAFTAWLLRLKEVVLLQVDAASYGWIFLFEDASALSQHLLAVLDTEEEVREATGKCERDVSTTTSNVD
jgi:hypothetical protein